MPRPATEAIELRTAVRKGSISMDGDLEGHEFRGNQYIGGMSYGSMSAEQKVKSLLKAKKILQPASKGKFSETQVKAAENLIKHANAWKGKSVEKVVGVAKTPSAVAATKQSQSPKPGVLGKNHIDSTTSAPPPGTKENFEWKVAQNAKAQASGSILPYPVTAQHTNFLAQQKGEPIPHPSHAAIQSPGYMKYTDPAYVPAQPAPAPVPQAKSYTVGEQMEHTTRDAPLSTPQYHAIQSYTGSGYHAINNHLRKGESASAEVKAHIAHLDEAFKGSALKEDKTVWRGVSREDAKKLFGDELRTGMTITDKGIVSTSTSQQFASNWKGTQGILLEIKAPKGAPALDVHKLSSSGQHEREILLPRGVAFKIDAVELPSFSGDKPIKVKVSYVHQ